MIAPAPEMSAVGAALASIGIIYGLYGAQVFVRQRNIVFHPARHFLGDPGDLGLVFEDVSLPLSGGNRIHGWWVPHPESRKLVILLPGAIGNMSQELSTIGFLRRLGSNVLTVDYPGYGSSSGPPSERGCYAAAAAAFEYAAQDRRTNPADIVLLGRSMGGAVAARLASERKCGGLCIHSGFTSIPDVAAEKFRILPARYFCLIRFNTLKYLRQVQCPTLVLHAEGDRWIVFRHGERLYREANPPKRFLSLEGGHHGHEWQFTPGISDALSALLSGEAAQWR